MAAKLYATFTFDIEKGSFEVIDTNTTDEGVISLLETYLHSICGAGHDARDANILDVYKITLAVDMRWDAFTVKHDCGNLGLVAGILSSILVDLGKLSDAK